MSLILDAGALIAYERGNRTAAGYIKRAERSETAILTTTGAVAQVWRQPARQVRLGRLLRGIDETELTRARARSVGILLANSGTADVVDASLVDLAVDGDEILTSDPDDLTSLASSAGRTIIVTPVG